MLVSKTDVTFYPPETNPTEGERCAVLLEMGIVDSDDVAVVPALWDESSQGWTYHMLVIGNNVAHDWADIRGWAPMPTPASTMAKKILDAAGLPIESNQPACIAKAMNEVLHDRKAEKEDRQIVLAALPSHEEPLTKWLTEGIVSFATIMLIDGDRDLAYRILRLSRDADDTPTGFICTRNGIDISVITFDAIENIAGRFSFDMTPNNIKAISAIRVNESHAVKAMNAFKEIPQKAGVSVDEMYDLARDYVYLTGTRMNDYDIETLIDADFVTPDPRCLLDVVVAAGWNVVYHRGSRTPILVHSNHNNVIDFAAMPRVLIGGVAKQYDVASTKSIKDLFLNKVDCAYAPSMDRLDVSIVKKMIDAINAS